MDLLDESSIPESVRQTKREAREFAREHIAPRAAEYFDRADYPWEVVEAGRQAGLVGGEIDAEYGGRGLTLHEQLAVAEEFFRVDAGIGFSLTITSIGSEIYDRYGTDEQKERYLRPLAAGDAITGIAISEPDSGSDLVSKTTTAERDGDEWALDGEKFWVGNAVEADWVTVYAKTGDDAPHENYSLFIVPTDVPGYHAEHVPEKMSMRANKQAHVVLDECRIPAANLLGEEGAGFDLIGEWLNINRILAAGHGVGLAAGALEAAREFVDDREAYGQSVSELQTVQHKLADMRIEFEAARTLTWRAADAVANREREPFWAATAKAKATETAVDCAEAAMRLHGGRAVLDDRHVTRIYRDVRGPLVYDGVLEVQRDLVYREG